MSTVVAVSLMFLRSTAFADEAEDKAANLVTELGGRVIRNDAGQVTSLDLSYALVTDAGLKELASLPNLTSLNLSHTLVQDLTPLPLPNLTSLDLGWTPVTDAGLKELAQLQNLTHLSLNYTKVTDAGLVELARLQNIRDLALGGTPVTNSGLRNLAPLHNLRHLGLYGTKVTDAGLKELTPLQNLVSLSLEDKHISDASLKLLIERELLCSINGRAEGKGGSWPDELNDVVTLDLSHTRVTDAGLQELVSLPNLTRLDLSHTQVTDSGLRALAPLQNLTVMLTDKTVKPALLPVPAPIQVTNATRQDYPAQGDEAFSPHGLPDWVYFFVIGPIGIAFAVFFSWSELTKVSRFSLIANDFVAVAVPEVEEALKPVRQPTTPDKKLNKILGSTIKLGVCFAPGVVGSVDLLVVIHGGLLYIWGHGWVGWNEKVVEVVRYDRKSGAWTIMPYVFDVKRKQVVKSITDLNKERKI